MVALSVRMRSWLSVGFCRTRRGRGWRRVCRSVPALGWRWRDHRQVIEAIAWSTARGRRGGRSLPSASVPGRRPYERQTRWSEAGTWAQLFVAAHVDADAHGELDWLVPVDSSMVRVHKHGAAARRIGGTGRPRTRTDYVLADKGYSSRANRELLRRRGIAHTIPEPDDGPNARLAGSEARIVTRVKVAHFSDAGGRRWRRPASSSRSRLRANSLSAAQPCLPAVRPQAVSGSR